MKKSKKRGRKVNKIKEIEKKTKDLNVVNPVLKNLADSKNLTHLFNKKNLTIGQRAADALTKYAGSWFFIILLGIFIAAWIYLNVTAYVNNWDPWPFIILNLCLSCLAAIQAPIILMSQNRSNQRDRLRAEYDYAVNRKAEKEIRQIQTTLKHISQKLGPKK